MAWAVAVGVGPGQSDSLRMNEMRFSSERSYDLGRWTGGIPQWLSGKESACSAGGVALIPGLGRSPAGGNGHLLQYSCLEKPMDRGAWRAIVHGVTKSRT